MDTELRERSPAAAAPPSPAAPVGAGAAPPRDYPAARAPVSPVLSFAAFFGGGAPRVPSILDAGPAKLVTSGRIAIALALRQMGIVAGDAVLVPAFHCASMIEPVVWSGATPVFYRIKGDTGADLDDIATKITPATKVLMVTNYFGFPQNLSAIRAFCDAHGLLMLEDCAHCFLGEHKGQPVGSFGDYAIASSMKFFPIYEGGALVSARHSIDAVQLESGGRGFELKAALNALEDSFSFGRLGLVKLLMWLPLATKDLLWKTIKSRQPASAGSMVPSSSEGGFSFDPGWLNKRSSRFSRSMLKLVSHSRMGALRRRNYQKLESALHGIPGCRPLFASLPEKVYPWVFPLATDNPVQVFDYLKQRGVPIIRFGEYLWEGVNADTCFHSVDLSRRVMSFSCHQELTDQELDWMIRLIKEALQLRGAPQ
jgi:perosamine synthetase